LLDPDTALRQLPLVDPSAIEALPQNLATLLGEVKEGMADEATE
jgi:hypothetical protein